MSNNGKISFPEELRTRFVETNDLVFKDGSRITASEIWRFMTEEAPRRFPYVYDTTSYSQFMTRISEDLELFSGIKRTYLGITLRDSIMKAHDKGQPIVFIHPFQSLEPYHAAGVIPLGPGYVQHMAQNIKEGLSIKEYNSGRRVLVETGRKIISVDACSPQLSTYVAIQEGLVPIDYIAPDLCLRCSDITYLAEVHRNGKKKFPSFLVDYPVNGQRDKEWAVDYLAKMLRKLTIELGKLSNKEVSEKDLKDEIKIENKGRKLIRDYMELWWSADVPPTNSLDHMNIPRFGKDFFPDAIVVTNLLKEIYEEVKERVKHSVKGTGLIDEPVRLFVCGSGINHTLIDRTGGVMVGTDDQWSHVSKVVDEIGDPYENLSKAFLSLPHEQSLEERAIWTAEQVKKSRADGVIFRYQWGCHYQSAAARMITDIVKDKTGIPCVVIEQSDTEASESSEQLHNRVEAVIEMLR